MSLIRLWFAFGGFWCVLGWFLRWFVSLVQARIFSPHFLNSIKVTCAPRHTQRPYPCKKNSSSSFVNRMPELPKAARGILACVALLH